MLRRMATVVAATTALALAGAAPALADHVEYTEDPTLFTNEFNEGGVVTCEDLGLETLLDKVEDPDEGTIETDEVIATVTNDEEDEATFLDVDAKDGFEITAVIVKGSNSSLVYFHGPFEGLTAPDEKGISHFVVCGGPKEDDDDDNGKDDDDNGKDDDDNGKDDDDNGKDDDDNGKDDDKETPKPAVPTDVPAGLGDSGGSNVAGTVGLLAVAAGMAAGIAVLVRRRFVEDN